VDPARPEAVLGELEAVAFGAKEVGGGHADVFVHNLTCPVATVVSRPLLRVFHRRDGAQFSYPRRVGIDE
jgi:hypothetical protein